MPLSREKDYAFARCEGGARYDWNCPKCTAIKRRNQSEAALRGAETRRKNFPNWARPKDAQRKWASRAGSYVKAAVADGLLPDLGVVAIACVDCGARAVEWEHRDYEKPLDVEPVCRLCNKKRGTANWPQPRLNWPVFSES